MSEKDDKPGKRAVSGFGPDDDQEVRALEKKADRILVYGCDYAHLRGQLDAMEAAKEPVMFIHPELAKHLAMSWFQMGEMIHTQYQHTASEHRLLKEIDAIKAAHAEDLDRITGKVLQCEREVRELRAWKERAREQYGIPDTDL